MSGDSDIKLQDLDPGSKNDLNGDLQSQSGANILTSTAVSVMTVTDNNEMLTMSHAHGQALNVHHFIYFFNNTY